MDFDRLSCRYRSVRKGDEELRRKIKELATKHRRYGSPRLIVLLRRQGVADNHKRIERIYLRIPTIATGDSD